MHVQGQPLAGRMHGLGIDKGREEKRKQVCSRGLCTLFMHLPFSTRYASARVSDEPARPIGPLPAGQHLA